MVYIEYNDYKNKLHEALNTYNDILDEQTELFSKTQPQSTDYSKVVVSGGTPSNTFDEYLIAKQKKDIENRLNEAYKILKGREMIYKLKREELEQSKELFDKIYKYHYIDKLSIRKIESRVYLSKSEICRKLKIIRKNIN